MSQIKLCQVINPQTSNKRGVALLQSIKNSFKRNKIQYRMNTSTSSSANKQFTVSLKKDKITDDGLANQPQSISNNVQIIAQYQTQLTAFNFGSDDLPILLKYIYSKSQLSISDRNLIRRVLLNVFQEDFIIKGGGKALIQNLLFQHLEKGSKIRFSKGQQRHFYLILKGNIKIRTPLYEKQFISGGFFGDLQISSNQPGDNKNNIQQIKAVSEAILFKVSEQFFMENFYKYFINLNKKKQKYLEPCSEFLQAVFPIIKRMFIGQLTCISFKTGARIIKKNSQCDKLYFVGKQTISNNQNRAINKYKTLGLFEVIQNRQNYAESIYALDQISVFYIQRKRFELYFDSTVLLKLNTTMIEQSASPTVGLSVEKEVLKANKFMNIKRVKLPCNKRIKSQKQTQKIIQILAACSGTVPQIQFRDTITHMNQFIFMPKQNLIKQKIAISKNYSSFFGAKLETQKKKQGNLNSSLDYETAFRPTKIQRCLTHGSYQLNNPEEIKSTLASLKKRQRSDGNSKKFRQTLAEIREMLARNESPKAKIQEYRMLSKSIERDLFARMQRKQLNYFQKDESGRKDIDSEFIESRLID